MFMVVNRSTMIRDSRQHLQDQRWFVFVLLKYFANRNEIRFLMYRFGTYGGYTHYCLDNAVLSTHSAIDTNSKTPWSISMETLPGKYTGLIDVENSHLSMNFNSCTVQTA